MEVVGVVAGEVTGSTIIHVEREFGYFIHFRKSTNSLKHNIQQLTATKSGVLSMIDVALRNGELINPLVQNWMTRADLVLVQATELINEASVIKGWFRGWCCGRFSLGRKAEKKIIVIQGLCVEGSGFGANNISYPKPTQSLKLVGTEDFNAFASRDFTVEEIRKALQDDETSLVGVYGMPGVGKTALIKAIAKQVKEDRLFQEVVVVIVSQNPSLLKLQGDIAEGLGLFLTGDNLSRRAERLSDRLNQDDKTTLVILDDVWERIELSDVGIPYRNKGKCCKVVFTTRFRDVCDTMEANTKMKVAVLSEEDSWILFQKRSANVEDSSLARDVLKECKGLPLAIVTLGRALRNKDAIVWADTLEQMRKSIFEGMSSVVSSIRLSYNFLESESVKICFLFCCLFPEDHKIELDVLLMYMMGEKLLEDVDTYDEERGRLHGRVDKLVSFGLLLRYGNNDITMHDVVRDVAISIGKEHGFIVKAGRNLRDWPHMELGNCKRLSMMWNSIDRFPKIPINAPHLRALFLNYNFLLTELSSDFFTDMKSLITLDLSNTQIKSLPPSLSCLQNLCTLLLNHSHLPNLLHVYTLEKLEVLSLCYTEFTNENLEEIGNLSNLRILDLTGTSLSNSIRPALFSMLVRLEVLHVFRSTYLQSDERTGIEFSPEIGPLSQSDERRGIEFSPEIGPLSRLTSLYLHVYNAELCHIHIPGPWRNLTRFEVIVKSDYQPDVNYKGISRILCLAVIRVKEVGNWVLALLGRTNNLNLNRCCDLQSLSELCDSAAKGNPCDSLLTSRNLESLDIRKCKNLMHVVQMEDEEEEESVGSSTSNISSRITISHPPVFPIFPNLKIIKVSDIPQIRYVFTMRVARNLLLLKRLSITRCPEMEVLLKYEDGEHIQSNQDTAILPRLKRLDVYKAPKLKSFTNRNLVMELPSLKYLEVMYCSILEWLPFDTTSVPNLEFVTVYDTQLRYVFTMRVARNLMQLQQLSVHHCPEMEVLFKFEDGEDIQFQEDNAILPSLEKLTVEDAPKLKSFTNQNLVMELPSLELLRVLKCDIMERLPFHTTSVPNVKEIDMKQELFDRLEWEDESIKARLQPSLRFR